MCGERLVHDAGGLCLGAEGGGVGVWGWGGGGGGGRLLAHLVCELESVCVFVCVTGVCACQTDLRDLCILTFCPLTSLAPFLVPFSFTLCHSFISCRIHAYTHTRTHKKTRLSCV